MLPRPRQLWRDCTDLEVESVQDLHVLVRDGPVQHIQVADDAVLGHTLGDDTDLVLHMPADGHLQSPSVSGQLWLQLQMQWHWQLCVSPAWNGHALLQRLGTSTQGMGSTEKQDADTHRLSMGVLLHEELAWPAFLPSFLAIALSSLFSKSTGTLLSRPIMDRESGDPRGL